MSPGYMSRTKITTNTKMKTNIFYILPIVTVMALTSCQDKDYDIAAPILSPINGNEITGSLEGNDYVGFTE